MSLLVLTKLLVALLLIWCAAYAIYFAFVRSVILTRFKFLFAEIGDDLNLLLLSGKVSSEDAAFNIVKDRLATVRDSLDSVNLTDMLLTFSYKQVRPLSEVHKENELIGKSNEEIRGVSLKLDLAVGGTFAANSPFLLGILFLLLSGAALYFWFAAKIKQGVTDRVWGALVINHQRGSLHQVAYA